MNNFLLFFILFLYQATTFYLHIVLNAG